MKKLSVLALALMMALSMAACQGSSPTPASASTDASAAKTTETAKAEQTTTPDQPDADNPYAEPIVVSMNVMNAERNGHHVRNEIIQEKFNLTFNYVPCNWGEWNQLINTWISTDDAPDLIWWDLKGQQATQYKEWARQGAFAPFKAEYFTDARPNLKSTYETAASIKPLSVDGELYAWPSLRANPPEAQNCYTSHWSYRRDWAQDLGLYKEGDIYTWDEWIALIEAVLKEDPGKNGTANAGLVMPTWAFPHAAALFIGPPAAEGNETCSYIKVDGQYVWPAALPEYKEGVKRTYEMYQKGLIFKDNIVFSGNEHEDMIKAGLAFANYNVTGSLNTWTDDMMRSGAIQKREDFGIAIVLGWDGTWYMTQTEDYWTVTAMSHKITQDKVDRILDFWEYLQTKEGRQMRQWGKEGVDYEVIGDGLADVKLNWEFDDAIQSYINPFTNVHEFNEANGSENQRSIIGPDAVKYQYDERDRLWATFASGKVPTAVKMFDFDVSFGAAPNKDKFGSFGQDAKERLVTLIAQPNIDIETEWDKVVEDMMPRVQLVLDELNGGQLK